MSETMVARPDPDTCLPNRRVIRSTPQAARELECDLLKELASRSYSDSATFAVKLALEEALNNAIRHGNLGRPEGRIEVTWQVTDEAAEFTVSDPGEGFQLETVPDPRADENLEKPSGRGILLMRAFMDELVYTRRGNKLYMAKHKG
jgi:serine/threonine-protein kinase RsbW